jgi:hypothetical protein
MEMLLKPSDTGLNIKQLGDWKIYHARQYTTHTWTS